MRHSLARTFRVAAVFAFVFHACVTMLHAQDVAQEAAQEEKQEPYELHELASAGVVAVTNGNIPLMKALLQAGLPVDAPLTLDPDGQPHWTALHICCVHNKPEMMKFLLKNGAYRQVRDAYGDRPIDDAMEKGNETLCKLLAIPDEKEEMRSGVPDGIFDELLRGGVWQDPKLMTFVCVNGKDPDSLLMFTLGELGEKRANFSLMEVVENAQPQYRHKQTKEPGRLVEIEVTPRGEFGANEPATSYTWSVRISTGKFLSGGGTKGVISRRHGYWVISDRVGWDE